MLGCSLHRGHPPDRLALKSEGSCRSISRLLLLLRPSPSPIDQDAPHAKQRCGVLQHHGLRGESARHHHVVVGPALRPLLGPGAHHPGVLDRGRRANALEEVALAPLALHQADLGPRQRDRQRQARESRRRCRDPRSSPRLSPARASVPPANPPGADACAASGSRTAVGACSSLASTSSIAARLPRCSGVRSIPGASREISAGGCSAIPREEACVPGLHLADPSRDMGIDLLRQHSLDHR